MAKRFTREELVAMGMDDQQIAAILATYDREDEEVKAAQLTVLPEKSTELKVTDLSVMKGYAIGSVVQLPDFGPGQPFVARLKRPSLLTMAKTGKIPNSLIEQATSLFAKGTESLVNGKGNTLGEMCDIVDVIVEAALVEPTLKDLQSIGLELSDEQKMAIFSYSQGGVKALEQFRI